MDDVKSGQRQLAELRAALEQQGKCFTNHGCLTSDANADSGGPVAVDFQDGHGNVIIGVASASFNPLDEDSPCGYGAIDVWASFTNPGNRAFLESHGLQLLGTSTVSVSVYLPLVKFTLMEGLNFIHQTDVLTGSVQLMNYYSLILWQQVFESILEG